MIQPITSLKGAFDLSGKNVIVTGGNRGLGLCISRAMAEVGANIAILCRDMEKAGEALAELSARGGKHESFSCDVTEICSVRKAVAEVYESYGEINVLVNNAGVTLGCAFLDMDEQLSQWRRVMDTNLNGVAYMTYEAGKRMRDAGKGGAIINLSSVSGIIVHRQKPRSPYNVAKAGVIQFTRAMAMELGKYDIRVNAIAPGFTRAGFSANPTPEILDMVKTRQPLDRLGEGIEVGALAVYLASPAAAHLTGTIQIIDGGYTLS